MTAQEPLWAEPPWVDAYPPGTRVRSRHTGNTGTVIRSEPGWSGLGQRLVIRWDRFRLEDDAYEAFHGSPHGLERVEP